MNSDTVTFPLSVALRLLALPDCDGRAADARERAERAAWHLLANYLDSFEFVPCAPTTDPK